MPYIGVCQPDSVVKIKVVLNNIDGFKSKIILYTKNLQKSKLLVLTLLCIMKNYIHLY